MKKTIFRLSALVLALVMLLAVLGGCKNPNGTVDNGGNTDNTDNPGNTTITEPIRIKTTIYEIAKHGNLVLYMYGKDLYDKGFEHGDIVEIAIGEKKWDVPLCTSYSDVDNGEVVLRSSEEANGMLFINVADIAKVGTFSDTITFTSEIVEAVSLISFTVEGTPYQAEKGMTWYEWVNSNYSNGNFHRHGTNAAGVPVLNEKGIKFNDDDVLIDGATYVLDASDF
mgnify:CR=1 FL=1